MEIRTVATGPAVCDWNTHYAEKQVTVDPAGNPMHPPCSRRPAIG